MCAGFTLRICRSRVTFDLAVQYQMATISGGAASLRESDPDGPNKTMTPAATRRPTGRSVLSWMPRIGSACPEQLRVIDQRTQAFVGRPQAVVVRAQVVEVIA